MAQKAVPAPHPGAQAGYVRKAGLVLQAGSEAPEGNGNGGRCRFRGGIERYGKSDFGGTGHCADSCDNFPGCPGKTQGVDAPGTGAGAAAVCAEIWSALRGIYILPDRGYGGGVPEQHGAGTWRCDDFLSAFPLHPKETLYLSQYAHAVRGPGDGNAGHSAGDPSVWRGECLPYGGSGSGPGGDLLYCHCRADLGYRREPNGFGNR